MSEIRILSLWQPWATLIALSLKQYETRSWGTDYRGKLAIHAAKRKVRRDEVLPILYATGGGGVPMDVLEKLNCLLEETERLPLGAIVAIADLTECRLMTNDPYRTGAHIYKQTALEIAVGNWAPGRYAWKLENVCTLDEPIPFKGSQGLRWLDDASTLLAISAQIDIGQEVASAAT